MKNERGQPPFSGQMPRCILEPIKEFDSDGSKISNLQFLCSALAVASIAILLLWGIK